MTELLNRWSLFNLRESPFFQETLGEESHLRPMELFVARTHEREQLLTTIGSATASRQAVAGSPGIGKTTLVQAVKAEALQAGYATTNAVVSCMPEDSTEVLLGRLLGGIYDAVLAARPHTIANPAMQAAQQVVRAFRLERANVGVSGAAFGISFGSQTETITPADALRLAGPKLIHELLHLVVRTSDLKGVVLHLNNLENLSDRDTERAAEMIRSLRDIVLMEEGLHILLVGTPQAIQGIIGAFPQTRSVFSTPLVLGSLGVADVHALLAERYRYLARDPDKPVVPPVSRRAVDELYPLFRGDLRGLFKAFEEGTMVLAGVSAKPGSPIEPDELTPVLCGRARLEMQSSLEDERVEQLRRWAADGASTPRTQAELSVAWNIKQSSVSTALKAFELGGWVMPEPRQGREAIRYHLTGIARLALAED